MSARLEKFLKCPHKKVQGYTEICLDCGENVYTTAAEIIASEEKAERLKKESEEYIRNEQSSGW